MAQSAPSRGYENSLRDSVGVNVNSTVTIQPLNAIGPNNNAVTVCHIINLLIDGDCTVEGAKNTYVAARASSYKVVQMLLKSQVTL